MFKAFLYFEILLFSQIIAYNCLIEIKNDKSYNYLADLYNALNYMMDNIDDLNIDSYFGVLLTNVYLDNKNANNFLWKKTLNLSHDILQHQQNIESRINNPYLTNIEKYMLNKNLWRKTKQGCNSTLNCGKFYWKDPYNFLENFDPLNLSPNEVESDMCLSEIITVSNQLNKFSEEKYCSISKKCYNSIITGISRGYSKTHRLLYFLLCRMEGCIICGGKNTIKAINDLCCDIMQEMELIEDANFPMELRDLFMEQVILCGISGYYEVLKPQWIEMIKNWQRPQGCWGYYDDNSGKRLRRSTTSLGPEGCSSHMTALGVTVLALALDKSQCSKQE